jgi:hypothetical protein
MKKIFLIALLALFFVGCQQATNDIQKIDTPEVTTPTTLTTETKPFYVKNSKWEDVDITKVSTSRAVAVPSIDEALAIIAAYNAETNDDQLHLYTEDVPIEEAPTVDVFIVNEGDYVVLAEYIGLDRSDFVSRRADFDIDARGFGGILFVDKIPPVPVVIPDTRTRHEKYSIYMVNKYDKIVVYQGFKYEKHIDELWDSLTPEIQAGYDNNIDKLMDWYIFAFNSESVCQTYEDAPWRVVSGQIYTEPVE